MRLYSGVSLLGNSHQSRVKIPIRSVRILEPPSLETCVPPKLNPWILAFVLVLLTAGCSKSSTTAITSPTPTSSSTSTPSTPAPTVSFTGSTTDLVGQPFVLSWSSTNATSCTASGAWSGTEQVSGSQSVTPTDAGSLTYTITCAGAGGSANASVTVAVSPNNSVAVTASFGATGSAGGFVNMILTTITVCQHGTQNCATIPNVEIDTGSIGLRLLPAALGSVALTQIQVSGQPLQECIQFGDTSYAWGPMQFADVNIAGESASNVPVQILGPNGFTVPSDCLAMPVNSNLPNGGDLDTLATLGANGILGIGHFQQDCGTFCASVTTGSSYSGYPYYICPSGTCEEVGVPTNDQAANPVAMFSSSDRNGVVISLPSVGATGATSVTGTMTFGIATQADNALGSATIYSLDPCADFPTVTYHGTAYTDTFCSGTGSAFGGFLDTGSTGLYVSDASTLSSLGISDCAQNTSGAGFYCVTASPAATLSNIAISGDGVGSGTTSLTIYDATTLVRTHNAVFNDLGADSGTSPSTDFFDFGAPFFMGRTVFIGIAGEAVSGVGNVPNGFVAF